MKSHSTYTGVGICPESTIFPHNMDKYQEKHHISCSYTHNMVIFDRLEIQRKLPYYRQIRPERGPWTPFFLNL